MLLCSSSYALQVLFYVMCIAGIVMYYSGCRYRAVLGRSSGLEDRVELGGHMQP